MNPDKRQAVIAAIHDVAKEPFVLNESVGDEWADAALRWLRNERRIPREALEHPAGVK